MHDERWCAYCSMPTARLRRPPACRSCEVQGGDYEPKERVAAHQATQQPQLTIGKVSEEADSAGLDWEAVDSELPAGLVADDDTEGNGNSSGGSAKDLVADLAADLASDEVLAELGEGKKGQRQGQEQQQQRAGGGDQGDHQQHVGKPQGMLRPHRQLRCAVVNNRGWHLDVAGGFAWAFQAAGCNVTLYLPDRNIFGIKVGQTDVFAFAASLSLPMHRMSCCSGWSQCQGRLTPRHAHSTFCCRR